MRKLMLAAMLSMVVVGVPAIAQVEQTSPETPPDEEVTTPPSPSPLEAPPTPPTEEVTSPPPTPNETPPTPPSEEVTTPPSPAPEAPPTPVDEVTTPPSPPPETPSPVTDEGSSSPPTPTEPPRDDASPPPPEPPPTPPAEEVTSPPSPPSSAEEGDVEAPRLSAAKALESDGPDAAQKPDDKETVAPERWDKNDLRDNRWDGPPGNLWGLPHGHRCGDPRDDRCDDHNDGGGLDQEIGQEAQSGDVNQSANVTNTGDNVNQCVAVLQAANTGNLQNGQGAAQDRSKADDVRVGGSTITVTPQLVQDCRQIIVQVAAAQQSNGIGGGGGAKTLRGNAIGSNAPLVGGIGAGGGLRGSVINPLSAVRPGLSVGQPRTGQALVAPTGQLPRTGGLNLASLLTLGAGVLLTAGGLLIRRLGR